MAYKIPLRAFPSILFLIFNSIITSKSSIDDSKFTSLSKVYKVRYKDMLNQNIPADNITNCKG